MRALVLALGILLASSEIGSAQAIVGQWTVEDPSHTALGGARFYSDGTFTAGIPGGVDGGTWREDQNGVIWWDGGYEANGFCIFVDGYWVWFEFINGQWGYLAP